MTDLSERIGNLSPAKRAFLEQRLRGLQNSTPIARKTTQELAPLAFRSDGEGTPLFLFHYLSSSQALARNLTPSRPVFGIDCAFEEEMYAWEETGRIAASVEGLAERCVAELRIAQPRGPYLLAGFCFGGVLAFEVASQLTQGGEHVAFLGLLDSFYLPGIDPASVPWLMARPAGEPMDDMTEAEKEYARRVGFMREIVKPYRGERYRGRAALFRAMANRRPSDRVANGWKEILAEGVELEDCQTTRIGLFAEPFVAELGARLGKHLSHADVSSGITGELAADALPRPDGVWGQGRGYAAPRTEVEARLSEIWSQVLRVERVGVHDRFFELGGDSIRSIQVVARAAKAGLRLTVKQIFQYPTIAELALAAEAVTQGGSEQGLVIGDAPLTPIERWFFEQDFADRHHWNQAQLLELRQDLDPALLERALQALTVHHDALRLRFERDGAGWRQFNAGADGAVRLRLVDLAGMPEEAQASALTAAAAELQGSLDLERGPLIGAALFRLGAGRPSRLLLVVHHLAVDGVSWRILLEDLEAACERLGRGEAVKPPAKTTSFRDWAQRLARHAHSPALDEEADTWLTAASMESRPLPADFRGGANTEASAGAVSVSLSAEETEALLKKVPQAYNTEINDVLLSALALALTSWTGEPMARIHLEGHGREELFEGIDLSRTVGWFTTLFPVTLDVGGARGPGEVLKSVKEQLRHIPQRGIGYGMLRYLRGEEDPIAARLRSQPEPEISFNYLGQFDQTPPTSPFASVAGPMGPAHSPRARRSHLLSVNGLVADGRLRVDFGFSGTAHRRDTIERLAHAFIEALRSLIGHCTAPGAGGYTPSDFAEAGLDQEELDSLIAELDGGRTDRP